MTSTVRARLHCIMGLFFAQRSAQEAHVLDKAQPDVTPTHVSILQAVLPWFVEILTNLLISGINIYIFLLFSEHNI